MIPSWTLVFLHVWISGVWISSGDGEILKSLELFDGNSLLQDLMDQIVFPLLFDHLDA